MNDIKAYIAKKRPTLSASSITTYASILKNLYKRVFGDGDVNLDQFEKTEPVLKYLADMPPNRRKTILSSLVIITDKKPYRDLMATDVRDYNRDISKQEKTPQQEASWVETADVRAVSEDLKRNADLIMKKKNITPSDLQQIQNYIIMCVLGSLYIKPRRSKDFVDFKIRNVVRIQTTIWISTSSFSTHIRLRKHTENRKLKYQSSYAISLQSGAR